MTRKRSAISAACLLLLAKRTGLRTHSAGVRSHHLLFGPIGAAFVIIAFALAGCATTSADRLRVVPASNRPATDLATLTFDPARDYVVATRDGRTTRGRVTTSGGALVVMARTLQPRVVPDDEIVLVGVVAGASRMRRGCIGAVVGAVVSLPFGISIKGDMVVPAAILGAQVARRTGDERVEVLLDRRPVSHLAGSSR